tara:strand:+ start:766 stop:984 length:219 start_codon:yes stop_codon:yes gene_type:complete
MPAILDRLVKQLKAKGYSSKAAWAIAVSKLQKSKNLVRGTMKATRKGIIRGRMTPIQREKDRNVKRKLKKKN